MRNKWIGIVATVAGIIFSAFSVRTSTNSFSYCFGFYLLGSFAGYHFKDFVERISSKMGMVLSILGLAIGFAVGKLDLLGASSFYWYKLIWCVCLWFAFDCFTVPEKIPSFMKMSFFIYCAHEFFVRFLEKIIWRILPGEGWFILVNMILTSTGTVALCVLAGLVWKRWFPMAWKVLNGGRGI